MKYIFKPMLYLILLFFDILGFILTNFFSILWNFNFKHLESFSKTRECTNDIDPWSRVWKSNYDYITDKPPIREDNSMMEKFIEENKDSVI